MNKLNKDELFLLAIELSLPDLLTFCSSGKRINDLVCKRDDIWNYKLNRDFMNQPNYKVLKSNPKDNYTLLYKLTQIKEKLNVIPIIDE